MSREQGSPTLAQALRTGLEPMPSAPSAALVPTSQELARFQRLLEARDGLPATDRLIQAKALILCGLPYKRTSARSVDRQARTGTRSSISVTFTAVNPVEPLPFGADRALLGWIQTLAYGSPVIKFERLTDFFRAFGLSDSGREYRTFRERLARLLGLSITVELTDETGVRRLTMHPLKRSFTPHGDEARELLAAETDQLLLLPRQFGLELDPDFHAYLLANPVPLPLAVMRAFHSRPKAWDFASLVLYRSYAARTASVMSWSELEEQIASNDTAERRLKGTLAAVLQEIRIIYPSFPARFLSRRRGLVIEPWRPPKGALAG